MPGPPPKPTALKVLQGNPGKRPLNKHEPQPEPDSGYCPRHLDNYAAEEWRRVVPDLRRMGLLTIVDRSALEAYCVNYGLYRQCKYILEQNGLICVAPSGYLQQRPEVAIMRNALKEMRAFMTQFGMTPASRSKISVSAADEESAFEQFLKASGQR